MSKFSRSILTGRGEHRLFRNNFNSHSLFTLFVLLIKIGLNGQEELKVKKMTGK